jgi:ABC-type multidrug transport system fused ATPase/permease subunit
MLFKGSLRENLDLLSQYNDETVWSVLEKVQMKDKFVSSHGLLTEIKEGGENLSAGEKQLICIARAILNKSKIILIDEATSNIDTGTEQKILDTIHSNFLGCTVLTIAHRLKTIISSDKYKYEFFY